MLNIYYGNLEDAVYNTSVYFDNTYLASWFEQDFTKAVIKDIDKGEILGPNCINTQALGPIPPVKLAGGTKTLILIFNEPEKIFNASTCGDNCAKWILQIAKERDVTINLHHSMNFGTKKFTAKVLNNNKIVNGMGELIREAVQFL